jgi:CBS domain-containing protein
MADFEPDEEGQKARLAEIAATLKKNEKVSPLTVRTFLHWFWKSQRRGTWITAYIKGRLSEAGLKTVPDFESTYLDAEVNFVLAGVVENKEVIRQVSAGLEGVAVQAPGHVEGASIEPQSDPTYRVSKLAAANRPPVYVSPDATLAEAITKMMANDYSQLPVMTSDREVKGAISWRSIGRKLSLGARVSVVRDAMESHVEISFDASLFVVIPQIVEHQYVLVRAPDKKIVGIVTTSDLSVQFRQLSEPFLLLGEIENHIRHLINQYFSVVEMAKACDPGDAKRDVKMASDLTFGEYKRLLEEPDRWNRLKLKIDRAIFISFLDKVRAIRNDVMHFDPDGIAEDDLKTLRDFSKFLGVLQDIRSSCESSVKRSHS